MLNCIIKDCRSNSNTESVDDICKKIAKKLTKRAKSVDIDADLNFTGKAIGLAAIIIASLVISLYLTHDMTKLFFGIPLGLFYFLYIKSLIDPIVTILAMCRIAKSGLSEKGYTDLEFISTIRKELDKISDKTVLRAGLEEELQGCLKYYATETSKTKAAWLKDEQVDLVSYDSFFHTLVVQTKNGERKCIICEVNISGKKQVSITDNGCILNLSKENEFNELLLNSQLKKLVESPVEHYDSKTRFCA